MQWEFRLNFELENRWKKNPAKGMTGYGTYNQPEGTWSDDSSLTFCLAESLAEGYDLKEIAKKFIRWKNEAYWSARGEVFDIGLTTSKAISSQLLKKNEISELKNQKYYGNEQDNGNGSLMRIIPLLFLIKGKSIGEQFEIIWEVSALTHRHIRAAMSCLIYLKLAEELLEGKSKELAYLNMRNKIVNFWDEIEFSLIERLHFDRIIKDDVRGLRIRDLKSGGYVIEVLESSIWFFLSSETYKETILSIINIGHDTDTSAAIAGGLAGIYYGREGIPDFWLASIARMEDIFDLGIRLNAKYCN